VDASGQTTYGGPLYDMFLEVIESFQPKPQLDMIYTWSTEHSRALFSSSYTACVHDVAVGNIDICVADLWQTPERMLLCHFTPAVKHDYMYLVVEKKVEEDTFFNTLAKPFKPLSPNAWAAVIAYVFGMSIILWLMKMWSLRGHSNPASDGKRFKFFSWWSLRELFATMFDMWHSFLQGGSHSDVDFVAGKFFQLGFAFFVLVLLASYTASLASMLVVQRAAVATIPNLEAAVDQNIVICVPTAILGGVPKLYPKGRFFDAGYAEDSVRFMYSRKCRAAVLSQFGIDQMHAGLIQKADCEQVNDGRLSAEEGFCEKGFGDRKRQDCDFMKVGDIVFSIPTAYPISERLAESFSWAVTHEMWSGTWDRLLKLNEQNMPKSQCDVAEEENAEEDGLRLKDLSGVFMISVALAVFGQLVFMVESCQKKAHGTKPSEAEAGRMAPRDAERALDM
jgi:hypothetical protein